MTHNTLQSTLIVLVEMHLALLKKVWKNWQMEWIESNLPGNESMSHFGLKDTLRYDALFRV